jgi:hypothetical protein
VIRPDVAGRRDRDDFDELIDELLPDSDERPGWFDAGLLLSGAALVGWGLVGPKLALVFGVIAVGLGCVLPARAGWRRVQRARRARRRSAILARGIPMTVADPATGRLLDAYDELVAVAGAGDAAVGTSAVAAAHGAMLDVATLLRGRVPDSDGERGYVETRAAAVERLTGALRESRTATGRRDTGPVEDGVDPAVMLRVREELEAIGGVSSLARLEEFTAEVRAPRGHH